MKENFYWLGTDITILTQNPLQGITLANGTKQKTTLIYTEYTIQMSNIHIDILKLC